MVDASALEVAEEGGPAGIRRIGCLDKGYIELLASCAHDLDVVNAARVSFKASSATEEGGPRIFLRADRGLDYGRVMHVMGEINAAGLKKVALVSTQGAEAN